MIIQGNRLFLTLPILLTLLLAACTSAKKVEVPGTAHDDAVVPRAEAHLQAKLGMIRASNNLGFEEKKFNPCEHGIKTAGKCPPQFMTVVHFQLLCRDSEGTVQSAPLHLTPIIADRVTWQLGGRSGGTRTDTEGYGQLTTISNRSTRNQRLILRIGKQFLGVTAGETTRLVLPNNFCSGTSTAAN